MLLEAAHHQQMDMLRYLLRHHATLGIDVNATDDILRNVLFYMLDQNTTEMIKEMIRVGVQVCNDATMSE